MSNLDRLKALETKVDGLTKLFKISRHSLTAEEENKLLRDSIRGKIDTIREKLGGIKVAADPSYGHSGKQLQTVDLNLEAILDRVCWIYNSPKKDDEA